MNNQRGGILGSIFLIPVGVALMVGFFFLGYYVGKYQAKSGRQEAVAPPLPEIAEKSVPNKEEFTFYKTLSDKESKTVSIDLKPSQASDAAPKNIADESQGSKTEGNQLPKDRKEETARSTAAKDREQTVKKEPVSNARIRYTLQIASYQEKETAEEDVKKLKRRGYVPFVVSTDIEGKGTWYRVRLGSFSNKAAAEKLQKELRSKEGITSFVTTQ